MIAFRHSQVAPRARHASTFDGAFGETFTRLQSFDELFGPHEALGRCRELLEAQALDVGLAVDLSVAQLERVLAGEPLGHVMRVKRLLEGASVAVPMKPSTAFVGRLISASTLRNDLHPSLIVWLEVCVVMTSLLFTVAITWLLSPVQRCAFEVGAAPLSAACDRLVWVDSSLWCMAAVTLLLAACMCWFTLSHVLTLTQDELPRWLVRNWRCAWIGVNLSYMSFIPFFGAIATRCMLNQQNELRGRLLAGIFVVSLVLAYAWWFVSSIGANGGSCLSTITFMFGIQGFGSLGKLFPGKFASGRMQDK